MTIPAPKMKVEIWSDVMCPFCYLGKRKFENALTQFADKEYVEVEWKSFQLNPDLVTNTEISIQQYLSEHKDMSVEQVEQSNIHITQAGKSVGLDFHYDKVVMANTFRAHQLLKFAHTQGKQNEMEGRLFEAFFTNGENVDELSTLLKLADEVGLDNLGLLDALENNQYAAQVQADIAEAGLMGIHSVPYFVFNRKFAVIGAQDSNVFLDTLRKTFTDWAKGHPEITPRPATFSYKPI